MEGVRTFLESSTIHGLTYISTSRKYAKLFWILIVLAGFIEASFLIKESFDFWSESPVKTTIETLPISKIKFPKVTVCPPKNTYTNLNHDLEKADEIGEFDNDTRQALLDFVFETIHDGFFEDIRHNSSFLNEENKFHNWYNGYTTIQFIKPGSNIIQLCSLVSTCTLNGSFSTFGFAEEFNSSEVFNNFDAVLTIYPTNGHKDKNFTMKIEVFREQMTDLSTGHWDRINFNNKDIPPNEDYRYNIVFLPPYNAKNPNSLSVERKVSLNDIRNQKLKTMPGMMFKWYVDRDDVLPYRKYKGNYKSQIFVRLVNFVHENDFIGNPTVTRVVFFPNHINQRVGRVVLINHHEWRE